MGWDMADITKLTAAQAEALEDILKGLRHYGFDPDGAGIHSPNAHVETHPDGGVDWWIDSDEGFATEPWTRPARGSGGSAAPTPASPMPCGGGATMTYGAQYRTTMAGLMDGATTT